MKFILIPLIALVFCQLIKLIIALVKNHDISFTRIVWEGFWVGKFPSSHSAVLASSFYLLAKYSLNPSIVAFGLVISLLYIYGLVEDKKRQEIYDGYMLKCSDISLQKIATDKKLLDFSGHTFLEIFVGLIVGILIAVIFDILI